MKANTIISYSDVNTFEFDENFEGIEENWRRDWVKFFYTNWGQRDMPGLEELFHVNKNTSKKALRYALGYTDEYYDDYSRDELLCELYGNFSTISEFRNVLDDASIAYKENFVEYTTRGYSQGDYAEVVVMDEDVFDGIQQFIDNAFWDSPVWGRIEFQMFGTDYEFEFYDMDIPEYWNYPFDIDEAKKLIEKHIRGYFSGHILLERIVETILESVPDDIEY
jgi:hypothetical protein